MKKVITTFITIFMIITYFSCSRYSKNLNDELKNNKFRHLEYYHFNPKTTIISRIKKTPDAVLKYLKKLDNRTNYSLYIPNKSEMKIISDTLKIVPKLQKKVLKERLIAIYFVNNFLGSGYTDWVLDKDGNIYTILIINPIVFKYNISDLITSKENSCFINNDKSLTVKVDCGNRYNGFLYILVHETTHIVDYVKNVTPYVEDILKELYKTENKPFTEEIWDEYSTPVKKYDFKFRKSITFYGMSGGPKVNITEAKEMYKELSETPFVSLYGSLNWAEDLAEFVTFYHLTHKLNLPYKIKILKNNKLLYQYEPMKSDIVKKRFKVIENIFYK